MVSRLSRFSAKNKIVEERERKETERKKLARKMPPYVRGMGYWDGI
jgi:hypothetical protein